MLVRIIMLSCLCLQLWSAESIALQVSAPAGSNAKHMHAVSGGIPFPQGALKTLNTLRLHVGDKPYPAQFLPLAYWPDKSIKWVLVDCAGSLSQLKDLTLLYNTTAASPEPTGLTHEEQEDTIQIKGKYLEISIDRTSAELQVRANGKQCRVIPVIECIRLGHVSDLKPGAIRYGGKTQSHKGTVELTESRIEQKGPLRSRVLLRGVVKVPQWGSTLPKKVLAREAAGEIPFSLRFTIHNDVPLLLIDQKIIYTGEPDKDMITRWGFDLTDQGAGEWRSVSAGGVSLHRKDQSTQLLDDESARICWSPIKDGLAFIREGWHNRPCAIGGERSQHAQVDLWPASAGPWDLRRYAREWATGESGNRENIKDMQFFAQYAARGMAKSHSCGIYFGANADADIARVHSERSLLVAQPQWYAETKVFGHYQASSSYKDLEEGINRYLDYHIFNQDLYKWYGKLAYGFWQSRNGQVHRNDRWNRDYGRWGWALGDGAGRYPHTLMLQFLRTLDRTYFVAGEAGGRAIYDTSMVHTKTYMENAKNNWWQVAGVNHRHNVQPFGCPYAGLRGSYPYGQRMVYLLTGDGIFADGLDLVRDAAVNRITRKIDQALGNSGGTDGIGSGCHALLHAYEKTGDAKYLQYCRKYFDHSKVFTREKARLGYGPSFGLFTAASEYIDLSNDEEFKKKFLDLAERGLTEKKQNNFLTVFVHAWRISNDKRYKDAVEKIVSGLDFSKSLAELPRDQWPGHGGALTSPSRGNIGKDLPYAFAILDQYEDKAFKKVTESSSIGSVSNNWMSLRKSTGSIQQTKVELSNGGLIQGALHCHIKDNNLQVSLNNKLVINGGTLHVNGALGHDQQKALSRIALTQASQDSELQLQSTDDQVPFSVSLKPIKLGDHAGIRFEMQLEAKDAAVASCVLSLPLALSDTKSRIMMRSAGAFRLEQWRVDNNTEQIPEWLNSDKKTRWPIWRQNGIVCGSHNDYRIVKVNRDDTSPLVMDEGFNAPMWFDVSEYGNVGVTVKANPNQQADVQSAIFYEAEKKQLELHVVSDSGQALKNQVHKMHFDVLFHDGWRSPLQASVLDKKQYSALLNDLSYGENIGLFAYRFRLSTSHKVKGEAWKEKIRASGVRASELLLSMEFRGGLAKFCEKIKVAYQKDNVEGTILQILQHYKK